ncbi:S-adenosyl-L-methionine-dependent methyltransferase [Halteromyces radiatus]|uniref:S-adenosyl-L-methionine-dependent methyltransferase n=1 Tax=Halteromyces radiatus TaxID=101107 RepID=UPI00221FAEF7|nr:S-adenosyl-L-methionine-dependent methyltransferase [Halteromyces radiatus]KAI8096154.1 S-adenosyl-L-methionine-dependent methyltransferase [Halteromyces radiatus]
MVPHSNLLSSLFRQQFSNDNSKRRSHSLDQGNQRIQSYFPTKEELDKPIPETYPSQPPSQRKKSTNLVGSLFSKAKKHPRLKRAATLIETTANHYKKSTKDIDKTKEDLLEKDDNKNDDDDDDALMPSVLGIREDDVDRMQQKNDLIRLAFAGEFTRPIDEQTIENVLDIGCGPLSWAIDFAKEHPNANVIGMDCLNMIPPETAMDLPKNCQLVIHNCLKRFPYADDSIDLCHVRFMNASLNMDQYCKMVAHCWRVLKPGGYMELMEMDMMVYSPGPVTELLNNQVIETIRTLGLKPRMARYLRDVLPQDAKLTDNLITEFYRSLPIGVWGGRLGVLFRDDLIYALTHARHMDSLVEQALFENQLLAAEKELEQCKSYSNFHFLRVQKPF